jgi:hypothetical protein
VKAGRNDGPARRLTTSWLPATARRSSSLTIGSDDGRRDAMIRVSRRSDTGALNDA